jgi:hypothetical protein
MVFTAPFDKPSRLEMECTLLLYCALSVVKNARHAIRKRRCLFMDHGNAGCIISAVKIDTFRKCFENIASPSEVTIRRNKMDQIAATDQATWHQFSHLTIRKIRRCKLYG